MKSKEFGQIYFKISTSSFLKTKDELIWMNNYILFLNKTSLEVKVKHFNEK